MMSLPSTQPFALSPSKGCPCPCGGEGQGFDKLSPNGFGLFRGKNP